MFQTLDVSDAQAPRPSPSSPPAMFPSRQLKLFFYRPSFPSTSSAAIIPKSNPFVFCEGSPFFGTTEPLRPLAQILRISTLKVAPWRFPNFSADRNNHVVNVIFLRTFSQAYSVFEAGGGAATFGVMRRGLRDVLHLGNTSAEHLGTGPAIPNVFAVFIIIFPSCLLRDNIFHLLRKPPAVRCKAKFSYCPRRHTSRSESIPQCKRRFPHKLTAPKYLPVPYLRHPSHQPPIGDRPRKWLI